MACAVCESLKGYAKNRPPVVIFMVCLGGFAVVLLTLAYMVKVRDQLTNPDLTKDWNNFLESFADLEFCVLGNMTEADYETPEASPKLSEQLKQLHNKIKGEATTTEKPQGEDIVNTSLTMVVEMVPTRHFLNIPHNVTFLYATVTGRQLGFVGPTADLEMNVTVNLPYDWNNTMCSDSGPCPSIQILTCINLQAPVSMFPSTRQAGACYGKNETGLEYHTRMLSYPKGYINPVAECKRKPTITVKHKVDPRFTMMLTLEDRSVINLHLMHTSYFLFVMFVTLFCYAMIKGRVNNKIMKTHILYSEVNSHA